MQNKSNDCPENTEFSASEIISSLEIVFQNLSLLNKDVANISIKEIKVLNAHTLECQFYAVSENSFDVRNEIASVMAVLYGFFKDGSFKNLRLNFYAVRAFDKSDNEIMYAISTKETASFIGERKPIEWIKATLFQENTRDYRLSIAKKQISEIENALRKVIVNRLALKYGSDWLKMSIGGELFKRIKGIYLEQFGDETEDGNVLIEYTYVLQLRKIICTNWKDFSDLFANKIEFEDYIVEFNKIRREEAHNRDITVDALGRLKIIYEFMLLGITEKYPDIIPVFLIDNWKFKLQEIFMPVSKLPYSDSELLNESNEQIKLAKSLVSLLIFNKHYKDIEEKLKSVVVPVQKKKVHEKLLELIRNDRILHEELIEGIKTGNISDIEKKQLEIEDLRKEFKEFTNKLVLEES